MKRSPKLKPRKPDSVDSSDAGAARQSAVRWLSRREYAVAEITNKLAQAGYDADAVDRAVGWLLEHDLVSDQRFAESFVRKRISRGYGPRRIAMELKQKGVARNISSALLEGQGNNWFDVASRAYGKRFGSTPCVSLKEKSRRVRYLENRGFYSEQIQHALAENRNGDQ